MVEKIIKGLISSLGTMVATPFMKEIIIFIISICPVLELRGGLIAASLLKMDPIVSYILCIAGNIVPIPLILWFVGKLLNWMRNSKKFKGLALKLDKKIEKNKGQIEKYGYVGLMLFIGIPLPGTGAWTGCMIASVLNLDKKKSFLAAVFGVLIASIIMMIISFGIISNIVG